MEEKQRKMPVPFLFDVNRSKGGPIPSFSFRDCSGQLQPHGIAVGLTYQISGIYVFMVVTARFEGNGKHEYFI